jgi:hypothetical protein
MMSFSCAPRLARQVQKGKAAGSAENPILLGQQHTSSVSVLEPGSGSPVLQPGLKPKDFSVILHADAADGRGCAQAALSVRHSSDGKRLLGFILYSFVSDDGTLRLAGHCIDPA